MAFAILSRQTNIDFVGFRRIAYSISGFFILLGLFAIIWNGGLRYGVDFAGGVMVQVEFAQPIPDEQVKTALQDVDLPGLTVQQVDTENRDYLLRFAQEPADGALFLTLYGAGIYLDRNVQALTQQLDTAYSLAEAGNYRQAQQVYEETAEQSAQSSTVWMLLVRRSLVDQLNQTLATIPSYVSAENMADLAVETSRARAQAQQIRASFFSWF